MGTNYYLEGIKDPHSGESDLHIGKSSAGWPFRFHSCTITAHGLDPNGPNGQREWRLVTIGVWVGFLQLMDSLNMRLIDEYGQRLSFRELMACISKGGCWCQPSGIECSFHEGEFC